MSNGIAIAALRERVIRQNLRDSWWLAVDDQPLDRPMRLKSIESVVKENPGREFCILHQDEADEGKADWQPLYLTPTLRTQKSAAPAASGDSEEVNRLRERIAILEHQQEQMLEAMTELKALVVQQLSQRSNDDEDLDRNEVKMRQLRAKLLHPEIRLVG